MRYEVRVLVRANLAVRFETYMLTKHLPEILATGCFEAIHFEQGEPGAYRTSYQAGSPASLEEYLADHAARFRRDFLAHFPEGCELRREVWTVVQTLR